MVSFVPYIRVTHSGVYADGRPNTAAILLSDVNFGFQQQNRKDPAYVPAGGAIDIPYTSFAAFSYEQGDIAKFQTAGLVTAELIGVVPPLGTNQRYYQDNPGADGPGTYAESYAVLVPDGTVGMLSKVTIRSDLPAAVGETATLRLYRYRKTGPSGSFFYNQITDTFVFDSTDPWSWTIDLTDHIRDGFLLNPATDSIAISNVYTNTGATGMRALRVDFRVEVVEASTVTVAAAAPGVMTWPPT
jgi:hypothetical protein